MGPLRGWWHAGPDGSGSDARTGAGPAGLPWRTPAEAPPPAWAAADVRACLLGLLARSGLDGPGGSTVAAFRLVTPHTDQARLGRLLRESAALDADGDPALTVVVDAVFWVPDPGAEAGTYGRGRYLVVESRRETDTVRAGPRGLLPRLHRPDRPAHLDHTALHRLAERAAAVGVDALGAVAADRVDDHEVVPWVTPVLPSHRAIAGRLRDDVRDWRDAVAAHPAGLAGALLDLRHPGDELTRAVTADFRGPGDRMLRRLRLAALTVRTLAAAGDLPWLAAAYVKHAPDDEIATLTGGLFATAATALLEPLAPYARGPVRDFVARARAGRDRPTAPVPAPGVATRHHLTRSPPEQPTPE